MAVVKITFDGSSVGAKTDAEIYYFLLSNEVGIFKGFKGGINYSFSNGKITFSDGYASIYGRLIYIENNTQVSVALDSSKKGYVVLGINTNTNDASLYIKEKTSYPTLTTTNLLNSKGLYELVLCAYSKTRSLLTFDSSYYWVIELT
jgi:hypothetical protein